MRIENNNIMLSHRVPQQQNRKKTDADIENTLFGNEVAKQKAEAGAKATSSAATISPDVSPSISGEEYLKLYHECAAANSPEAKSAAEHKTLREAAGNTDAYSTAAVEAIRATAPAEPLPVIQSTDTTEVKLEKLRQIDSMTDYSGMSYEEIYTDLWNRYNDAFGGNLAAITGLATPKTLEWIDISNQFNQAAKELVYNPLKAEFHSQGVRWEDMSYNEEVTQRISDIKAAPLGYNGMSYDEKEAAILEKYQGKDSLLDFLNMQGELYNTMVYHGKNGFHESSSYFQQIRQQLTNDHLEPKFEQQGFFTWEQMHTGSNYSMHMISSEQWNGILQGSFDMHSFFIGLKDAIQNHTFENYNYDVRGMLNSQIDDFMGLLDEHWTDEN